MELLAYTFEMQPLTFMICAFVCILGVLIVYKFKKEHKYQLSFMLLFAFYILVLISLTMFPLTFITEAGRSTQIADTSGAFIQLVPGTILKSPILSSVAKQVLGNILLLMPMYIFIKYMINDKHRSTLKAALISIGISFCIEIIQLLIDILTDYSNHICDIDDIICNSLGVFLGVLIFKIITLIKPLDKFIREYIVYKQKSIE